MGKDDLIGEDLIEAHNLTNIAKHVIGGQMNPLDYVRNVVGMAEFRKGPGLELAPVAEMHPALIKPEMKQLPLDTLHKYFVLQSGAFQLSEEEKGIPVASALGQAGTSSTATAASLEAKEKRKKDKKKRKREQESGAVQK